MPVPGVAVSLVRAAAEPVPAAALPGTSVPGTARPRAAVHRAALRGAGVSRVRVAPEPVIPAALPRPAGPATSVVGRGAGRGRLRQAERSGAVAAARGLAAAGAREPRHVAGAGHLDEDRAAGGQRGPGRLERDRGQARRPRMGVPCQLGVAVAGSDDARHRGAHDPPVGQYLARPARVDQQLALRRPGEAADQQRGAGLVGAGDQDVARVRVRRARLGVQVVAVVPDHEQARVRHRRERGRARADDDARPAAADGQPPPVPLRRPQVRGQRDDGIAAHPCRAGRRQRVDVPLVGHDEQGAAPAAGGRRRGLREPGRPVLSGQGLPDRVGGLAGRQCGEQRRPAPVTTPAGGGRRGVGRFPRPVRRARRVPGGRERPARQGGVPRCAGRRVRDRVPRRRRLDPRGRAALAR